MPNCGPVVRGRSTSRYWRVCGPLRFAYQGHKFSHTVPAPLDKQHPILQSHSDTVTQLLTILMRLFSQVCLPFRSLFFLPWIQVDMATPALLRRNATSLIWKVLIRKQSVWHDLTAAAKQQKLQWHGSLFGRGRLGVYQQGPLSQHDSESWHLAPLVAAGIEYKKYQNIVPTASYYHLNLLEIFELLWHHHFARPPSSCVY